MNACVHVGTHLRVYAEEGMNIYIYACGGTPKIMMCMNECVYTTACVCTRKAPVNNIQEICKGE